MLQMRFIFFCEKFDGKKLYESNVDTCQRLIVIVKLVIRPLSLLEQIAVEFFLNSRFDNPCALFFDRFLLNNNLIYSRSYSKKGGQSVNYCIKTASGRLIIDDKIMLFSENCPHRPIMCL